jgi:hypothetical protein
LRRLLLLIFLTLFGLGIGLAVGAILMHRVDRAASKVSPDNLLDQAVRGAANLRERWRVAVTEATLARRETEAQLRARYGVPTVEEAAAGATAVREGVRARRGAR